MFINKSNSIIQNSSFDLNTIELKVLSKIVSMINSKAEEFQYYYEFELKDFKNELSLNETNYTQLKEAIRQLSNKGFEIIKDKNIEIYSRWVSSVITEKGTGNIKIEIPKEMKFYYLSLNANYTSMKAIYIYKLRSKYSIRLYELLSSWKRIGDITYSLEELKKMFKTGEKYKRFYDFKRKVIEVAQKEFIKKNIDINFTYKSSGRGTNKKIFFEIIDMTKEREKELETKKKELNNVATTPIEINLRNANISETKILELMTTYDEMHLTRNIDYAYKAHERSPKRNLAGYLINCIEDDLAMKTHEEKKENKKNKPKKPEIVERTLFDEQKEDVTNKENLNKIKEDIFLMKDFLGILERKFNQVYNILTDKGFEEGIRSLSHESNKPFQSIFYDQLNKFLTKRGLNE